ncbi:hypothetical protein GUJ93_ZPchr0006g44102 [Zizania palustris]|uniref:Uncharacterized protein n=1 Tax=Zizania palustris TaxID=103762 RepID=A0A8J5VK16_ZIZPA|nr:hypothetical protein GUJ93_ZPchr0006g44102 [Zizania palustris]
MEKDKHNSEKKKAFISAIEIILREEASIYALCFLASEKNHSAASASTASSLESRRHPRPRDASLGHFCLPCILPCRNPPRGRATAGVSATGGSDTERYVHLLVMMKLYTRTAATSS